VLSQGEPRDAAVNLDRPYVSNLIMERLCTLNTATLSSHMDASGTKTSTKRLESRLEVIQGHTSWYY